MKVFMQRWWIANRLHRYTFVAGAGIGPTVWVSKEKFIGYCKSIMVDTSDPDRTLKPLRPIYKYFSELPHDLTLDAVLKNLIDELSDPVDGINYLISENRITGKENREDNLRLSARGREIYAVSYLIFGTDYARKIWTGIIVVVVGGILMSMYQHAISPQQNVYNRQSSHMVNWRNDRR